MGRLFVRYLEGKTYNCKFCNTQLGHADSLVSKAFHCSSGRAYLFNNVVNITFGQSEERTMLPGTHTVTDIFCCRCGQILGWKYVIPLIPSSLSIGTNTRAKTYNHGNTHTKSSFYCLLGDMNR
ncbi:hypothetical protein AABB24_013305 [Solanum stoloniferum]